MMSLWDALRMNMMISYQELVRTFPRKYIKNNPVNNDFSITLSPVRIKSFYVPSECRGHYFFPRFYPRLPFLSDGRYPASETHTGPPSCRAIRDHKT
ncbi:hypothetical protein BME85_06770 [Klebsiella pneumoniae]|nr:hypothetical protein BME85_06770 [Klebsiella pneumoniae]